MKRFIWSLIIPLALVACSRNQPTPTPWPSPTGTTPVNRFTPTPPPTRVSRITIVPSATRLLLSTAEGTVQSGTPFTDTLATDTATPTPDDVPSPTATPRVIDAGATDTPPATAPPPDSPLSTPSPAIETPTSTARSEDASTETESATPSLAPEDVVLTDTPTATLESAGASWGFENVHTYYDDMFQEFYISGESVNQADSDQRITTLWPVVYDQEGNPVNTKDDVDAIGQGYKELREGISLAPNSRLAFSFLVYLPEGVVVNENDYKLTVESEPAEAARQDLEVLEHSLDDSAWPSSFYVEGVLGNPGPDLNAYLAIVVTLYDPDGRVIGLGWTYEQGENALTGQEYSFRIEVEMWAGMEALGLGVGNHELQLFGH